MTQTIQGILFSVARAVENRRFSPSTIDEAARKIKAITTERFLSATELAGKLGVHKSTVEKWKQNQGLPFHSLPSAKKHGRGITRYKLSEVIEWQDRHQDLRN